MPNFTDRYINALKAKESRYEVWEGKGFGIRITPRSVKSFVWVYHFQGQSRRMTLGKYPALSLRQARSDLAAAQIKLDEGKDPGKELVKGRQTEREAETIKELGEKYIRLYAKPKKRTWAEDERILKRDIYPRWGRLKARSITQQNVVGLLDEIAAHAPIMANRTRSLLSKMFRWGISRGDLEHNPVEFVERPSKEVRRERSLAENELSDFWSVVDKTRISKGVRLALWLLLVTAQRRAEVAGIAIGEIDLVNAVWIISGNRTKNTNQHKVPLSDLAVSIIREAITEAAKVSKCSVDEVEFLFPSRANQKEGIRPIQPSTLSTALIRAENEIGKRITPHDLRRTAHTIMGSETLGVPRFIRDKILNHSDRTPGAHYDVNEYLPEKRKALDAWGEFLSEKIRLESGNVVELGVVRDA
jgi:integrase